MCWARPLFLVPVSLHCVNTVDSYLGAGVPVRYLVFGAFVARMRGTVGVGQVLGQLFSKEGTPQPTTRPPANAQHCLIALAVLPFCHFLSGSPAWLASLLEFSRPNSFRALLLSTTRLGGFDPALPSRDYESIETSRRKYLVPANSVRSQFDNTDYGTRVPKQGELDLPCVCVCQQVGTPTVRQCLPGTEPSVLALRCPLFYPIVSLRVVARLSCTSLRV